MRAAAIRNSGATPGPWIRFAPPLLVVLAAMMFNALLAIANARGVNMGKNGVIAVEMVINLAAIAWVARHWTKAMLPWAVLLGGLSLQFLLLSIIKGEADPKLMRDVAIIPLFVMLGMTAWRLSLVRFLIVVQTIVVAVMIFEGLAPSRFGGFFNVTSYYINTRGFSEESFWAGDTGLFVSSFRPGDRFLFKGLQIHRLSSVFLEPVSLGNYIVIMVAAVVALRREFGRLALLYMAVTSFMVLVGCDGRQATMQVGLVIAIGIVQRLLTRPVTALVLPLSVLGTFAAVIGMGLVYDGDTFVGRLVYSVHTLRSFELSTFLGVAGGDLAWVADSGIAYFISTQSILGVTAVWLTIVFSGEAEDRASRTFLNAIAMYLSLSLLVSNAAFSIKTASLLWFTLGDLNQRALMRLRLRASRRWEDSVAQRASGPLLEPVLRGAQ